MWNTYALMFNWIQNAPKVQELEPVFDTVGNWLRLSATDWMVTTTLNSQQIRDFFLPHVGAQDRFVVIKVDPKDCNGWHQPFVWDWINSKRDAPTAADYLPGSYKPGNKLLGS